MLTFILDEEDLHLEEGRLCLDFANTLDWHASEQPIESLITYADLVSWSLKVGLIPEADAGTLLKSAELNPDGGESVRLKAIELREAIYRILSNVAHDRSPDEPDLDTLNKFLAEAMAKTRIVRRNSGFTWEWIGEPNALDRMLGPIARSAADLLTSEDIKRVGECADETGCGWLFLDTSRNRSRRWCSMDSCGNRAKAKRHYTRQKVSDN